MKKLIKFCHKHNIYDKVYYNTKSCNWKNDPMENVWTSYLNDIIQGYQEADAFFVYAFSWEKTNEGRRFWADISHKWIDFCKINEIKYFQ